MSSILAEIAVSSFHSELHVNVIQALLHKPFFKATVKRRRAHFTQLPLSHIKQFPSSFLMYFRCMQVRRKKFEVKRTAILAWERGGKNDVTSSLHPHFRTAHLFPLAFFLATALSIMFCNIIKWFQSVLSTGEASGDILISAHARNALACTAPPRRSFHMPSTSSHATNYYATNDISCVLGETV